MVTTEQLIFLLREAIGVEGGENAPKLGKEELYRLYKLSKKHDVAQLVAAALDKRGELDRAEDQRVAELFRREQTSAIFRCENLDFEIGEICRTLDTAEIDHIPLKGAVIRSLYPESWMRTSCDIDVLVRERDLDAACSALTKELGYSVEGGKDYHDISLISPSGFHLELHYSIKENIPSMDKTLERVWSYAERAEKCQFRLTNEFFMLHFTTHAAYHFLGGGCGVRPLLDLHFLRKSLSVDEKILSSLLDECGLSRFYNTSVKLSEYWFGKGEEDETLREMAEFILEGGVYGSLDQKMAVKRSEMGKAEYLRKRIFLPYSSLKILYPKLEGRRALTPIYQVARWGKLCRGDVRRQVKREMNVAEGLDNSDIDRARRIVKDLGLENLLK